MLDHDDTVPLVNQRLQDFDQATHSSFFKALYRNVGSRTSGVVHSSFLTLVRRLWSRVER